MAFINILYNLWPNGDEKATGLRDGIAATAQSVFARYGIDNPLLVAHVMAQISHECGAGHDIVENLSYSAERMTQVWPSRFPTVASAVPYAHNPQALADKVYNGRMGNAAGSDDGWNFRGRGGAQTTGREGYENVKKHTGIDVISHPEYLIDPRYFLECAVADFVLCGCLPYAKADDVLNVTKRLNGGTTGLDQRVEWLKKWKMALGSNPTDFSIAPPIGQPLPPKPIASFPPPPPPKPPGFWASFASIFTRKV